MLGDILQARQYVASLKFYLKLSEFFSLYNTNESLNKFLFGSNAKMKRINFFDSNFLKLFYMFLKSERYNKFYFQQKNKNRNIGQCSIDYL